MKRPLLKAHAGCEHTQPNSAAYLARASQSGADIIEIDVQCTADGVLVALHDDDIDGLPVVHTAYERLRARAPWLLPLEQALAQLDGYPGRINLDLKSSAILAETAALARRLDLLPRIILTGIQGDDLATCRSLWGQTPIWVSAPYRPAGLPACAQPAYLDACLELLRDTGCADLNIYVKNCWPDLIRVMHERAVRVHVWTVDTAEEMRWMIRAGADSITTNYPALLRQIVDAQPAGREENTP